MKISVPVILFFLVTSDCDGAPPASRSLPAPGRIVDWQGYDTLAEDALHQFALLEAEMPCRSALAYAYVAYAHALKYGWKNDAAKTALEKLRALENPNGGYGLNEMWDAFGDGTANDARTTYTVTLADHVGPTFLAHARDTKNDTSRRTVARLVELIHAMPKVLPSCLGYSNSWFDLPPRGEPGCVHNVNVGAAAFLELARTQQQAIVDQDLVADIVEFTWLSVSSTTTTKLWPYAVGVEGYNDIGHEAYQLEALTVLTPEATAPYVRPLLERRDYSAFTDPIGQQRLVAYDCAMGAALVVELRRVLADPRVQASPSALAQAALWARRNALTCGGRTR